MVKWMKDMGVSAEADRATHEPSPDGLGHAVSVPDADRFVAMVAGYRMLPSSEMLEQFPEYAAHNFSSKPRPMEHVLRFFCETAQAIEARRAATTGTVEDESAVLKGCAHD